MAGTQNFLLQIGLGELDKVQKMVEQLMPVTIASVNAQFQAGADIVISPFTSAGHKIAKMMLAASGKVENENPEEQILHASQDPRRSFVHLQDPAAHSPFSERGCLPPAWPAMH